MSRSVMKSAYSAAYFKNTYNVHKDVYYSRKLSVFLCFGGHYFDEAGAFKVSHRILVHSLANYLNSGFCNMIIKSFSF